MPLRDHYRPPVSKRSSWEGFHGGWPAGIIFDLFPSLPDKYVAEPRVHLGTYREIEAEAIERHEESDQCPGSYRQFSSELETAPVPPMPTLTLDVEFPEQYAYEILIFDLEDERRLVAAVEMVCPANKDRPASRQLFAAKCFNLLCQDVCVSIVDLVTIRQFNLYAELLILLNGHDPRLGGVPAPTYAVTCRKRQADRQTKLDTWFHPLAVGQSLPSLPILLSETLSVTIDLESSYEGTCRVLRIP